MTRRKAPARRQLNREGSPWQRGDGRWTARVWPPEGSIDRRVRYVYAQDRAGAIAKRDELKVRLARGLPAPSDPGVTIGEYMRGWLDVTLAQYARSGDIAAATRESYRDNARMHILPYLSHIRLRELTAPMVRQWQDELVRKPSGRAPRKVAPGEGAPEVPTLSPRTVAYCRSILHKAIEDAITDEVAGLERNVVTKVRAARDRTKQGKRKKPPRIVSAGEAAALLLAASQDRLWCYWLLAFALGFRRSEGLGICWADIDLERRVWQPARAVQRERGEPDPDTGKRKGKLVLKELKSDSSVQPVALPVTVCRALERWQAEQLGIRMTASRWGPHDLVFTTSIGTALEPRNVNRAWTAVCERAGVGRPVRLHDLRHACASYLIAAGVDIKTVQATLRHARMETTEIYLHVLEQIPTAGADAMDRILVGLHALPSGGSD